MISSGLTGQVSEPAPATINIQIMGLKIMEAIRVATLDYALLVLRRSTDRASAIRELEQFRANDSILTSTPRPT